MDRCYAQPKWQQLFVGVLCLAIVSNIQYGWTLFVEPMSASQGWSRPAISWAFFFLIFLQTWLVPFEGWVIDTFGPFATVLIGGLLSGSSWIVNASATTLPHLYVGAALGGVGSGMVLAASYGNVVKWFTDRRGLAVGTCAAGYAVGTILTLKPIAETIRAYGYQHTFIVFGVGIAAVLAVLAFFVRAPRIDATPVAPPIRERTFHWREVLQMPAFWVMYLLMALVASGGLMISQQLNSIAKDFGVASVQVSFLGTAWMAVTLALTIDRFTNGISRLMFGKISDSIGREKTMFLAFCLEGIGICLLAIFAHDPVLFVLLSAFVFFAWGEIFSLFPSLCTDLFGRKYAATNYGLLYTAKGMAAGLAAVGTYMAAIEGWRFVFMIAAAFDITAAILAITVLRSLRKNMA